MLFALKEQKINERFYFMLDENEVLVQVADLNFKFGETIIMNL